FALALHTLILLAHTPGSATSQSLAGGVNTHSSCVRRMLSTLGQAGLVDASEGRDGGYRLALPADSITLKDIYCAVANEPLLLTDHRSRAHCPISAAVGPAINAIVADAEARFQDALERRTLADVAGSFDGAAAWLR
ncbi:MAG: Rrf2 family transcriptional regulator, partial [Thermomicrobiales bacterium]|nr:Rrf2 family transcriptional regulator [Thermomicrobiales bacterium]